jgi:hypothetical protein
MIGRVHKKVCAQNAMRDQSADAQRTAALLIREFQYGVNKEAALMTAFMGDGNFKLSVPVGRLSRFIGNALDQWESDDEVTALR